MSCVAQMPNMLFILFNLLALLNGLKMNEISKEAGHKSSSTSVKNLTPEQPIHAAIKKDQLYHVHIPKAAGISFGLDAMGILDKSPYKIVSNEGCFSFGENPRIKGDMVLFRQPVSHILSMYNYCNTGIRKEYRSYVHHRHTPQMPSNFSSWLHAWIDIKNTGFGGNFIAPPNTMVHRGSLGKYIATRISAWQDPPYSAVHTLLDRHDWPNLDGGGTIWHMVNIPYECYPPINLQTQRMTCQHPLDYPKRGNQNVSLAIDNMEKAYFVGIVEAYKSSSCLLYAKIWNTLPPQCNCDDPERWKEFPGHHINLSPHDDQLDFATSKAANELTVDDTKLYQAAWRRFVRETTEVQQQFGMRILCDTEIPNGGRYTGELKL